MLENLQQADFQAHLNENFRIQLHDGELDLQLIEVSAVGQTSRNPARTPFSLVFRGPADLLLHQGIYPLTHPTLGSLPLFLVPIGPDAEGLCYEVVFN